MLNSKKILAAVMAMMMVLSTVGATGMADDISAIQVINGIPNPSSVPMTTSADGTLTLNTKDLDVTLNNEDENALTVTSNDAQTPSTVTVNGSVKARFGEGNADTDVSAIEGKAVNGGKVTVTAGQAMAQEHPTYESSTLDKYSSTKQRTGVYAESDGAGSSVTIEIGMHDEDTKEHTARAYAYNNDESDGNEIVSSGVQAIASGGGTTLVNVEGNSRSQALVENAKDLNALGMGVNASAVGSNSKTTVTVGSATGHAINNAQDGNGKALSIAINASATNGGTTEVKSGDALATIKGNNGLATGVKASADESGTVSVSVNNASAEADVVSHYEVIAVDAEAKSGGNAVITIEGNATVSTTNEKSDAYVVRASADGKDSKTTVQVKETSGGTIHADSDEGNTNVTIMEKAGSDLQAFSAGGGKVSITVGNEETGDNSTATNVADSTLNHATGEDENPTVVTGDIEITAEGANSESIVKVVSGNVEGNVMTGARSNGNATAIINGKVIGNVKTLTQGQGNSTSEIGEGIQGQAIVGVLGGGSATLTVKDGGVTSKVLDKEIEGIGKPIAVVVDGPVVPGGASALGAGGAAVNVVNYLGSVEASITGDISADTAGIMSTTVSQFMDADMPIFSPINPAQGNASAATNITINGNVLVDVPSEDEEDDQDEDNDDEDDPEMGSIGLAPSFAYNPNGIRINVAGEGAETNLTMNGSITVKAKDAAAAGLEIGAQSGGQSNVKITGDINVSVDGEYASVEGIQIQNYSSTVNTVVDGNVNAEGLHSQGTSIVASTNTIYILDESNLDRENIISEQSGARSAGRAKLDGQDVELFSVGEGDERQYYVLLIEGEIEEGESWHGYNFKLCPIRNIDEVKKESTKSNSILTINGDVTAENYGTAIMADENANVDLFVDGTVQGTESSLVLVNDTKIGDNVSVTVWELKANDQGEYAHTAVVDGIGGRVPQTYGDYGAIPEEDAGVSEPKLTKFEPDQYKEIKYIIRVKADQQNMISTSGTKEVERNGKKYNVAKENDTVTLVLSNIPEGYEVTEAYSDQATQLKLEKDSSGNYYLTVPRGGAVELSIKLEPEPEPEEDEEEKEDSDKQDEDKQDEDKKDEDKKDEDKQDEDKKDDSKQDEDKKDDSKQDEDKKDDSKQDDDKKDDDKKDDDKKDDDKQDEDKKDDDKKDDEQDDDKKDDDKQDDEKLTPPPYKLFTVTIDPNGGMLNGHNKAYSISVMENCSYTLLVPEEAPEGCELVGWYVGDIGKDDSGWTDPEEDDPNILKAGESITITKNVVLTAIWRKK